MGRPTAGSGPRHMLSLRALLQDISNCREHVLLFDLTLDPPGIGGSSDMGRKGGISGAAGICREVLDLVAYFSDVIRQKPLTTTWPISPVTSTAA